MTDEVAAGSPEVEASSSGQIPRETRIALAGRLRLRRLETDEAIFARVRDLAPGAAGLEDPEYMAGLRAAVAAALEYVLEGIEGGEKDGSPPPTATLEQARRAARTGVSLDTVLRRYVAGLAILEGFVVQAVEQEERIIPPTPIPPTQVLRDVLANMSALVDRLITAVSRAYGEEIEPAPHAPSPPLRASPTEPGRYSPSARIPLSASIPASASAAETRRERTSRRDRSTRMDRILQAMVEVAAERGFFAPFFFPVLWTGRRTCIPGCSSGRFFGYCSGGGFFGCAARGYFGFFFDLGFVGDLGGVARDEFLDGGLAAWVRAVDGIAERVAIGVGGAAGHRVGLQEAPELGYVGAGAHVEGSARQFG
jgi:hypothetical protein